MSIVELHPAYVWDCDECGVENFERAIEGDLNEPIMQALDHEEEAIDAVLTMHATQSVSSGEIRDDGAELMNAAALVGVISVLPKHVTCKSCGNVFAADICMAPCDEEFDDE